MDEFKAFLTKKKIDASQFEKQDTNRYQEWLQLFGQVSEASFVAQKLFLINKLRRQFKLEENEEVKSEAQSEVKKKRPAFRRPTIKK